jgi:hypothetical protein
MDDHSIDYIRRSIAAIHLLVSGPTPSGSLDPAHVENR